MAGLTIDPFDEESVHGDARGRKARSGDDHVGAAGPIVREEFFNLIKKN